MSREGSNPGHWFLWIQWSGLHRRIPIGGNKKWHIETCPIGDVAMLRWPLDLYRSIADTASKM